MFQADHMGPAGQLLLEAAHFVRLLLPPESIPPLLIVGETSFAPVNIINGRYTYMEGLMALDACCPTSPSTLPLSLFSSACSLPVAAWEQYLSKHPDGRFSKYILEGLALGFHIGYDRSSRRNMKSAQENKEVVSRYIA